MRLTVSLIRAIYPNPGSVACRFDVHVYNDAVAPKFMLPEAPTCIPPLNAYKKATTLGQSLIRSLNEEPEWYRALIAMMIQWHNRRRRFLFVFPLLALSIDSID